MTTHSINKCIHRCKYSVSSTIPWTWPNRDNSVHVSPGDDYHHVQCACNHSVMEGLLVRSLAISAFPQAGCQVYWSAASVWIHAWIGECRPFLWALLRCSCHESHLRNCSPVITGHFLEEMSTNNEILLCAVDVMTLLEERKDRPPNVPPSLLEWIWM